MPQKRVVVHTYTILDVTYVRTCLVQALAERLHGAALGGERGERRAVHVRLVARILSAADGVLKHQMLSRRRTEHSGAKGPLPCALQRVRS